MKKYLAMAVALAAITAPTAQAHTRTIPTYMLTVIKSAMQDSEFYQINCRLIDRRTHIFCNLMYDGYPVTLKVHRVSYRNYRAIGRLMGEVIFDDTITV